MLPNRLEAAIELLRFKTECAALRGDSLYYEDINEVLLVAGSPIIVPHKNKDLEVIR